MVMLGVLCLQTAWALVVPPFRGSDEHDHAFKAAAVAAGDWSRVHETSPLGWGDFMTVPAHLPEAAEPICTDLPYTNRHNCRGIGDSTGGQRTVATSAARYNPVFYAWMGTAARPFEGAHALYAMRAASAIACAFLVALAVAATRRWSRSSWPMVGLVSVLTPTMTYSLAMAAPNGVELAAALVVWSALLGIAYRGPTTGGVLMATVGAVPLVVVRGMGPLWMIMIALGVALLVPGQRWRTIVRRRSVWLASAVVLAAALYATWWSVTASTARVDDEVRFSGSPWTVLPGQVLLWLFQSVAAFPARNEMAPLPVYAVYLAVWGGVLAIGLRVARRKEQISVLALVLLVTGLPIAVTVLTYPALGTAWQGRYTFPVAMGVLLVCTAALDRASGSRWTGMRWPVPAVCSLALVAHVVAQVEVLAEESRTSPLTGDGSWLQPAVAVVLLLNVVGFALLARALADTSQRRGDATAAQDAGHHLGADDYRPALSSSASGAAGRGDSGSPPA